MLVTNLEDLPERIFSHIEDMGIDDGIIVEYSDLLDQCGHCRKIDMIQNYVPKIMKLCI